MALKVAVQMDPIETIDIKGDSTFAMMLEADRRGHALMVYQPDHLAMLDGEVFVTANPVEHLADEVGNHVRLSDEIRMPLKETDVVLMRQDPPFDMNYTSATHLLERVHPETLVVNNPAEVRNAPEKLFVCDFPDLMPPTLITRNRGEILRFREAHGDMIVKPLYGNGGAGVFMLKGSDQNLSALLEMFEAGFREPFVIQKFLPDVSKGDKRIILVDGEPVGAINRLPAEGENRSNMHVGGTATATELTDREREICTRIGPELKRRGFLFVGIDVIGDYMTEINVTSPTGIREVKAFGGADIAALIWDAVEGRVK